MRRICAPIVNEAGVALALTLVLLTLVAVLVLELNYLVRVDIHAATNFRDSMRGYYLAKSGVTVAKMLFSRKIQELEELKRGLLAGGQHSLPFGEDLLTLRVTDEGGKINLNALVSQTDTPQPSSPQGRPPPDNPWIQIGQDLFQRLGIDPTLVGAIKDWVDQDDLATGGGGAESSYYRGLEKPYTARNGPMETMGELRLIRGFTDEVFLKLGAKRVGGIVDPTTNAYLTVLPTQPGAMWKVNLNTAPPLILASLTGEVGQFAELIVQQRSKAWIEKMGDLQQLGITGVAFNDFNRRGTLTSTYYLLDARGTVGEITKQVTALLKAGGEQGGGQILYWRVQ
ncbi:MAG: type II secretion system minor pseudopilin GspK [Nitrospinae bacterium]|nr:type II secretion system minor pseudopilin GspK [Nitrospinota bacterium]